MARKQKHYRFTERGFKPLEVEQPRSVGSVAADVMKEREDLPQQGEIYIRRDGTLAVVLEVYYCDGIGMCVRYLGWPGSTSWTPIHLFRSGCERTGSSIDFGPAQDLAAALRR